MTRRYVTDDRFIRDEVKDSVNLGQRRVLRQVETAGSQLTLSFLKHQARDLHSESRVVTN